VLIMVMQYVGNKNLATLSNGLWSATILLLVVDTLWMRFRLHRDLKAKFPDENLRGTTFYAFVRVLQLRFMRMPKPHVKLGQKPS
jgi:hypothetical protein